MLSVYIAEFIQDAPSVRSLGKSHRQSYVLKSNPARRVFDMGRLRQRCHRESVTYDDALSHGDDSDLRPPPSFCAGVLVYRRVSKRLNCRVVSVSPSGHPDADDDHIKRDGNDGRHLAVSKVNSVGLS